MKKTWMLILVLFLLSFAACGTQTMSAESVAFSTASPQEPATNAEVPTDSAASSVLESETVDVIYFKKLGDNSIMVACYTEDGTALFGGDYFVAHVGEAELYNAAGEQVDLDGLTRGCELRITWPGMVMESYPAQIAAARVDALSDEPLDGVPPEEQIPPLFDGPIWWETEPRTEPWDLTVNYTVECLRLCPLSAVSFDEEHSASESGDHTLDSSAVQGLTFDGSNTLDRQIGPDSVSLHSPLLPDDITVTAYIYGDATDPGTAVELDEDKSFALLDGDHIYVVEIHWDTEAYQGDGTYAFLALDSETP